MATWLEVHTTLPGHPKTRRAARQLSVSVPQTVGHIVCLWLHTIEYFEDGDLSLCEPQDIADAAQWTGDADLFLDVLVSCGIGGGPGFLERTADERLVVRSWEDYAGRLLDQREHNRTRKRESRQRAREAVEGGSHAAVPDPSHNGHSDGRVTDADGAVTYGATVPDRTGPNQPNQPNQPDRTPPHPPDPPGGADVEEMAAAIVAAVGFPPTTPTAVKSLHHAAKELVTGGADPGDVAIRVTRMRDAWGSKACTHAAIARHWDQFAVEQQPAASRPRVGMTTAEIMSHRHLWEEEADDNDIAVR